MMETVVLPTMLQRLWKGGAEVENTPQALETIKQSAINISTYRYLYKVMKTTNTHVNYSKLPKAINDPNVSHRGNG